MRKWSWLLWSSPNTTVEVLLHRIPRLLHPERSSKLCVTARDREPTKQWWLNGNPDRYRAISRYCLCRTCQSARRVYGPTPKKHTSAAMFPFRTTKVKLSPACSKPSILGNPVNKQNNIIILSVWKVTKVFFNCECNWICVWMSECRDGRVYVWCTGVYIYLPWYSIKLLRMYNVGYYCTRYLPCVSLEEVKCMVKD